MKYRLKKDLPFAKAGAEVIINEYEDVTTVKSNERKGVFYLRIAGGSEFDKAYLISEGWIEEIKPREFWVYLDKGRCLAAYDIDCGKKWSSNLIKVREVIE